MVGTDDLREGARRGVRDTAGADRPPGRVAMLGPTSQVQQPMAPTLSVRPMLRHVVLIRWKDEVPAGHVDRVADALRALPARGIPFQAYNVGPDLGMAGPSGFDFAVVGEFADEADWRVYMDDPEH